MLDLVFTFVLLFLLAALLGGLIVSLRVYLGEKAGSFNGREVGARREGNAHEAAENLLEAQDPDEHYRKMHEDKAYFGSGL